MEDQSQDPNGSLGHGLERGGGGEPVRSRWTPKPEQILILESIFNSGMVNPPKDETVRIRKLLEKFGAVGDANVFYWFQNRRSRSRRRQRQMQAASLAAAAAAEQKSNNYQGQQADGAIDHQDYDGSSSSNMGLASFGSSCSSYSNYSAYGSASSSSSSSCGVMSQEASDSFFPSLMGHHHVGFPESDQNCTTGLTSSILCHPESPNMHYQQSGIITVFINGVPTEVPRGPLDMKSVFGQDAILVNSSGLPVPTNEYGYVMQSLEHGESYFLVSRPT